MTDLYDRFSRINGANQAALTQAAITLVGCGGLGGEIAHGLVRKGIGQLTLLDFDVVEESNLHRQWFMAKDVGKNKAHALGKNLIAHATGETEIKAIAYPFQTAHSKQVLPPSDIVVVGVDNNPTRIAACQYGVERQIPLIFLGVDPQASKGYVFVQASQPETACFVCMDPNSVHDDRIHGCAGSSIDILKVMAGIALYAIDSLLMDRPRDWNYKAVFFNQQGDGARTLLKRKACVVCAG